MTNMQTLDLSGNSFTKLAGGWAAGMLHLNTFFIQKNSLTGSLPAGKLAYSIARDWLSM